MEELDILLAPNKEQKKLIPNLPVIGFRNGKNLQDYLVRETLPFLDESGRCKPCGKKSCLVRDSISTATTEVCQETFKIQSGPLTCDSKKVLCLLKCKVCDEVPHVGKTTTKLVISLLIININMERLKGVIGKLLRNYFTLGIEDWDFALFQQCKTHTQLKKTETVWQHRLKTFYHIGLNEKDEYLY